MNKEHQRLARLLGDMLKYTYHFRVRDGKKWVHYGVAVMETGGCYVAKSTWAPPKKEKPYDQNEHILLTAIKDEVSKLGYRMVKKTSNQYNRAIGHSMSVGWAMQGAAIAAGVVADTYTKIVRIPGVMVHPRAEVRKPRSILMFDVDPELSARENEAVVIEKLGLVPQGLGVKKEDVTPLTDADAGFGGNL